MGMYTEIFINVNLVPNTPETVFNVLRTMCGMNDDPLPAGTPNRWAYLFNDGSYYTPKTSCKHLTYDDISSQWSLLGKGDINNYGEEIELFFDFMMPWIEGYKGDFIGYSRYEDQVIPTLMFLKETTYK